MFDGGLLLTPLDSPPFTSGVRAARLDSSTRVYAKGTDLRLRIGVCVGYHDFPLVLAD